MQVHKVEENENLKVDLRKEGRKWTYSNGDFDRVDLLYSPSWVQRWPSLEKLMRYGSGGLERSQRKKRVRGFRKMMTCVKMRVDYLVLTFSINKCFQFNNIIIKWSFYFYHFYSNDRFSRLLHVKLNK